MKLRLSDSLHSVRLPTFFPGIDGLIHISEIAHEHIANPAEVLKVGDTVKVKILDVDFDKKRVSLSRKALLDARLPR